MGNGITVEWITKELQKYQQEEIEALANLKRSREEMIKAKADYAQAKETLEGIRGGIKEFTWQLEFYEENGRLP